MERKRQAVEIEGDVERNRLTTTTGGLIVETNAVVLLTPMIVPVVPAVWVTK